MWSRVKNIALKTLVFQKNPLFSKKPIVFQHVHFFIPLFWNEKLSLPLGMMWQWFRYDKQKATILAAILFFCKKWT